MLPQYHLKDEAEAATLLLSTRKDQFELPDNQRASSSENLVPASQKLFAQSHQYSAHCEGGAQQLALQHCFRCSL
jgi:hypothetical protein